MTYHSVDPSGSVISIDDASFARHVRWLASNQIQTTSVPALLDLPPDANAVALTFDDGFANFSSLAWPLLRDHGLSATLFLVTDRVGGTNVWDSGPTPRVPRLPLLDWSTLGRLAEEGVTLGAHSRTHADLRTLDAPAICDEIEGAVRHIARETGTTPAAYAYPYGAYNDTVIATVRGVCGWACTADFRPLGHSDDRHRLPRLDTYYFRRPGSLETWGTSRFRSRVWLRARARGVRRVASRMGVRP